MDQIILKGVRTHNLKNFNLSLPHGRLIAITGVSGSGKSSLAIDTLYAEGQSRYVESLSAYARQFLERMERPDVDSVTGILPAVAIEAKNIVQNARSTVGTQTEINDYLRVLFSRVGETICPSCTKRVEEDSAERVAGKLVDDENGKTAWILFPVSFGREAAKYKREFLKNIEREGFIHFFIGSRECDADEVEGLITKEAKIKVIADRIAISPGRRSRLVDSIETAYRYGKGECEVAAFDGPKHKILSFSRGFHCATCKRDFKRPVPNMFSFNSPLGACPECQGFGRIVTIDPELVVPDDTKSINEGAIEPWTKPASAREFSQLKNFARRHRIPLDVPYGKIPAEKKRWIWEGKTGDDYFSVKDFFEHLAKKLYKIHVRVFLARYRAYQKCPACGGSRIKPEGLCVKVRGRSIHDLCEIPLSEFKAFLKGVKWTREELSRAGAVIDEISGRVGFLNDVGVGYLTLERLSRTLSGGEAERIHLASSLGSHLTDTLYVLDEPSVGLHERDNEMMIRILKRLRDLGNTVVVVEHDKQIINSCDEIVDLGPLAGDTGGRIVFHGSIPALMEKSQSLTAKYLRRELEIKRETKLPDAKSSIKLLGAYEHNLKNIDVTFPLHCMSVITGVSGSGKSTLLFDVLYNNYLRLKGRPVSEVGRLKRLEGVDNIDDMVVVDQSPIGRTPRSNPVTYIKAFDEIRKIFASTKEAKRRSFQAGHFSFNTKGGRCEACEGQGKLKVEMHFLADIYVECEQCGGTRYKKETLEVQFKGKNIHDVLGMTVDEAVKHFEGYSSLIERLNLLQEVGLGYLKLGQSATTLSSGEAQRIKLALELAERTRRNLLYIFDEPTVGLHYHDIQHLMRSFDKLIERGHSILIIEHNMEVIKCADYVIDLGPEGGDEGGRLLYAGDIRGLFEVKNSYTGRYLSRYLRQR
ncbi:MAG: excinuclease ABC subunit UvrA [Candidatus Omnitrophica bacterium]|nr:excinuclease ABC subunit UvrA [Candidatus Omnitrophota bacterium]